MYSVSLLFALFPLSFLSLRLKKFLLNFPTHATIPPLQIGGQRRLFQRGLATTTVTVDVFVEDKGELGVDNTLTLPMYIYLLKLSLLNQHHHFCLLSATCRLLFAVCCLMSAGVSAVCCLLSIVFCLLSYVTSLLSASPTILITLILIATHTSISINTSCTYFVEQL